MSWWTTISLVVLCLFVPHTLRAQNCNNETCITFFNRTCGTNDDCAGPCIANHIDFGGYSDACFPIDEIDWETFIQRFDPTFKADDLTTEDRLQLLIRIARFINEYNLNNPNVTLAINKYSANSSMEDLKAKTGYRNVEGADSMLEPQLIVGSTSNGLPSKHDWVEEGAITSVKDQGRCGCCWAIASAGAIEAAAAINSNFTYLQSVSFQQFISCDDTNFGCDGGNMVTAMVYAVRMNENEMVWLV